MDGPKSKKHSNIIKTIDTATLRGKTNKDSSLHVQRVFFGSEVQETFDMFVM